jgi:N-acetylmuramoyl-L-alanine amidase
LKIKTTTINMTKKLYLFDPGHGGMVAGQYVTPGKRSPKFKDGSVLYEGVNNRENVKRCLALCEKKGIRAIDIVSSEEDISLGVRCARANAQYAKRKCAYISVHSDAIGDGKTWQPATGISVWTSPGQTDSDVLAEIVINELQKKFGSTVTWRKDNKDGDQDKEAHFQVLTGTHCPAILIEAGFHTNEAEAARMLTDDWRTKLSEAITDAILVYDTK